jgi:hypothetical protein
MRFAFWTIGIALFLLALAPGRANAQEQLADHANWHLHQRHRSWLQPYDPTLIAPKMAIQWDHKDLAGGKRNDKIFVNVRESWRLTDSLAFGMQAELPVSWAKNEGERFAGLGDAEFRTGLVGRISPNLRWGLGVNLRFYTASDPQLGSGDGETRWELGNGAAEARPIVNLRWDAFDWLTLGLQPEYTFAPNSDDEFFQLKLPVAIELGESWSAELAYQPRWTRAAGGQRIDLIELTFVHRFGRDKRYAVLAGMEIPLSEDDLDWKSFVGLQWFFR